MSHPAVVSTLVPKHQGKGRHIEDIEPVVPDGLGGDGMHGRQKRRQADANSQHIKEAPEPLAMVNEEIPCFGFANPVCGQNAHRMRFGGRSAAIV